MTHNKDTAQQAATVQALLAWLPDDVKAETFRQLYVQYGYRYQDSGKIEVIKYHGK